MAMSSFKINLKLDKYLSDIFDSILPIWYNEALRTEIENENKEDIKNSGLCSFLSKGDLQYSLFIFNRYNSCLWDYVINSQDSCYSVLVNYKKVCQAIQKKFGYQPKLQQIAIIMNIVYGKKNIIVNVRTEKSKSLIHQAMLLMNPRAIILTITPIIALIKNQKKELK